MPTAVGAKPCARGCWRAAATRRRPPPGRLLALEHVALTRVAAGYSGGLSETIERLRRLAEKSSPLDVDSGAIKPGQLGDRLSLEVERCQRNGPAARAARAGGRPAREGAARGQSAARPDLHQIGDCLRENLRRYDSVGLTDDGAFVLVLPDISRRGLAGAATASAGSSVVLRRSREPPKLTFALAHYDCVDVNAREMLTVLGRSMHHAREAHQPIAWA